MMPRLFVPALCLFGITTVHAQSLSLPAIFSDHALLQSGKRVIVWGHAKPGVKVIARFRAENQDVKAEFSTATGAEGQWSGEFSALAPGVGGQIEIETDQSERAVIRDVLTGEVWLASGQSNMTYNTAGKPYWPINPAEVAQVAADCAVAEAEAEAAQPPLRVFQVSGHATPDQQDDVKGHWFLVTPENVTLVSAVSWNFGQHLNATLHRPVGLIVSAVGGTPVEAWMPMAAIEKTAAGQNVLARYRQELVNYSPERDAENKAIWDAWRKRYPTMEEQELNRASRPPSIFTPVMGNNPAQLFNGMIHGLQPYAIAGAIWFQGDGNAAHPPEYAELIRAMITAWRTGWRDDFPFYYVELNNMREDPQQQPVQDNAISLLREQQQGALALPKVEVATAVDLGTKNAHFTHKKPLGLRLANLALHHVYGRPGLVHSPQFRDFTVEGNKIRLGFDFVEGLRIRNGGGIGGFAIRGLQGEWVWAVGEIRGEEIVLGNAEVPHPVAVRYGWAMNPVLSIENQAGLPLRPFRTDRDSKPLQP